MNSQQLGKIGITGRSVHENPQEIADIFKKLEFLPVKAELNFVSNNIEYLGISSQFREIKPGEKVNYYKLIVQKDKEGIVVSVAVEEVIDPTKKK